MLPTALVIIGSAGAATVFLHWMLFHQMPGQRVWQDKAFHLDEGTKLHGENEAARLFGLTISSAAVSCDVFLARPQLSNMVIVFSQK